MSHTPRKRFGQNFLNDPGIIDKLVRAIAPRASDHLVEIGPGQGALTQPLLASGAQLDVVELDRDLVAPLEIQAAQQPRLQVHSGDALKFDFGQLADAQHPLRVVGNLPYNISTPLLFHLLQWAPLITDMHFMLQKEVVDRLAATPGNKQFGRLSVMVQYTCRVDALFLVPPEAFSPRPKVTSAIVRLSPYPTPPWPVDDWELFRRLVSHCFQQRRKTLRKSLQSLISAEQVAGLPIDTQLRPDRLSVESWVLLANSLSAAH